MQTLGFGHLLGTPSRPLEGASLCVRESAYDEGLALPRHGHAQASFCLTLQGGWYDEQDGQRRRCEPGDVLYRPAGVVHAQKYARDTLCLNVELDETWSERLCGHGLPSDFAHFGAGSEPARLMATLRAEVRQPDDLSLLAAEGLCLQLVTAVARARTSRREAQTPAFVRLAVEFIQANLASGLALETVAAAVGETPARIQRAFRIHQGCSLPELIRRMRVDRAAMLLQETDAALVDIAVRVGFCDQSHLNRHFRRRLGTSPGAWRANRTQRPVSSKTPRR